VTDTADVQPVHLSLGLTHDEAATIERVLGRAPNHLELAMYAVMWSEHCSYKSSRIHLARLPTEGPEVLVGPGEGAGVVDAGDGVAVAIRIESHNHPSAIEPYQGAATGVGGIIRDIFSMGARPIAVMDPLRFGPLDEPRSRWIAEGVVAGISGYGNAVGVPTVGGELAVDPCYADNPLVNVLCVGLLPVERLTLARASGRGNLAVLLGSATGRDGIGGVSVLASAGFGGADTGAGAGSEDDAAAKRPSVQVGDPFEEKRLIEACLQLIDERLVVGVQDLGGAGLTCATSETASKAGAGMDVYVDRVPVREPAMAPFEIMTSESQERMLAIVTPADLGRVLDVAARWEVRATVVGTVTDSGRLRILDGVDGQVLADVPAASMEQDAPRYDRPRRAPADLAARRGDDPARLPAPADCGADVLALLAHPSVADTTWVSRQYDHQLFLNTVEGPGGDAAVLRCRAPGVPAGSRRGLALSTDGNGRWCSVDPRAGTAMVVAESALNVACAGARPVALVNNLNFGNPEHPEVMWQLSEAVDGMAEACLALSIPVVGGNVSLYNESRGADIDPTPIVGVLGLVETLDRRPPGVRLVDGGDLTLLGGHARGLAGSMWADVLHGHRGGVLPDLDLVAHGRLLRLVREVVADDLPAGIHDVSDGGLAVALAELCARSGIGVEVAGPPLDDDRPGAASLSFADLFSEAAGRVVACTVGPATATLRSRAEAAGVPAVPLGRAGGARLVVSGLVDLPVDEVTDVWRNALPRALGL
jgi:phosphoribosylformylglycinamidine synthase